MYINDNNFYINKLTFIIIKTYEKKNESNSFKTFIKKGIFIS